MARLAGSEELGFYPSSWAIVLLVSGILEAFLYTPVTVFLPGYARNGVESEYDGFTLISQFHGLLENGKFGGWVAASQVADFQSCGRSTQHGAYEQNRLNRKFGVMGRKSLLFLPKTWTKQNCSRAGIASPFLRSADFGRPTRKTNGQHLTCALVAVGN